MMVKTAITEASVTHKAASTAQMQLMFSPQTKVVEATDKEGNKTGDYIAVIPVPVPDPKTKQVTMVPMPVSDAVAEFKKNPEFANLFLVEGSGGVGGVGNPHRQGSDGAPDFGNMSAEEHASWRAKQGIAKKS